MVVYGVNQLANNPSREDGIDIAIPTNWYKIILNSLGQLSSDAQISFLKILYKHQNQNYHMVRCEHSYLISAEWSAAMNNKPYSKPPTENAPIAKPRPTDARGEILQHAKALFRQKGFSAVSMNDLVASVGLTKPTIYYHFKDKETLFTEVVIEMMRHGHELFSAGIKRCKDSRERLNKLAEGYFRFSPASLSTLVRDASEHLSEQHLKKVMEAHRFYLLKPIEDIFAEGIQAGEISAQENAETLSVYFISWIDAMTTLKAAYEGRAFDAKGCAATMVGIFWDGIAAR